MGAQSDVQSFEQWFNHKRNEGALAATEIDRGVHMGIRVKLYFVTGG
jgi:hypothetical protein